MHIMCNKNIYPIFNTLNTDNGICIFKLADFGGFIMRTIIFFCCRHGSIHFSKSVIYYRTNVSIKDSGSLWLPFFLSIRLHPVSSTPILVPFLNFLHFYPSASLFSSISIWIPNVAQQQRSFTRPSLLLIFISHQPSTHRFLCLAFHQVFLVSHHLAHFRLFHDSIKLNIISIRNRDIRNNETHISFLFFFAVHKLCVIPYDLFLHRFIHGR